MTRRELTAFTIEQSRKSEWLIEEYVRDLTEASPEVKIALRDKLRVGLEGLRQETMTRVDDYIHDHSWHLPKYVPSTKTVALCEMRNKDMGNVAFCLGRFDGEGWNWYVDGRQNNQDYELVRWLPYEKRGV